MTVELSSDTSSSSSSIFFSSRLICVNLSFDDLSERSNGASLSLLCDGDVVKSKRETILDGLGNCLN
jgi:hypothetical protein